MEVDMSEAIKTNKIKNLDLFKLKDHLRKPGLDRKVPAHQIEATQKHILDLMRLQNPTRKNHRPSPCAIHRSLEFLEYVDEEGAFGVFCDSSRLPDWAERVEVENLLR